MKKIIALLVCMALAMSMAGCAGSHNNGGEDVSPKPETPEEETVSYTVGQIQEFGRNDASAWELLQDLLPNLIVYRGAGGIFQYASIDRTLPQSDYDWTNLVEVNESPR